MIEALAPSFSGKLTVAVPTVPLAAFIVTPSISVIETAAECGARRVVHVSSVVAHGRRWPRVLEESAPLRLDGDHYAVSKAESEAAGFERARSVGIEFVVVRPTIVYGPRSTWFGLALIADDEAWA